MISARSKEIDFVRFFACKYFLFNLRFAKVFQLK